MFKFKPVSYIKVILIVSLLYVVFLNTTFFSHMTDIYQDQGSGNLVFFLTMPIVMYGLTLFLFLPFSGRYLLKPFLSLMILSSVLVVYGMHNYKIMFDYCMVQNVFETNSHEAFAYLNIKFIVYFLLLGVLPVVFLWTLPIQYAATKKQGILHRLSLVIASFFFSLAIVAVFGKSYLSLGRNHHGIHVEIVPHGYFLSLLSYGNEKYLKKPIVFKKVAEDARSQYQGKKPLLLVFALGETARAQNYAYNGYPRPANVFTQKEDVVFFNKMSACGTATVVSVPCMFSGMKRTEYNEKIANNQDNLWDILQRAGNDIFWLDNDSGCKDVCNRVPFEKIKFSQFPSMCSSDGCWDQVLLSYFIEKLSTMDSAQQIMVLHLMGSHGPTYYLRYPKEHRFFLPECARSDIENCTNSELVNTYDNTIRYTDYILAQTIQQLKLLQDKYDVALLYVSDHGESLGEYGLYLHGTPYRIAPEYQTKVPMMMWFSEGFSQAKNLNQSCLKDNAKNKEYSHDDIYHSMLGLLDVSTHIYQENRDLFAECRRK